VEKLRLLFLLLFFLLFWGCSYILPKEKRLKKIALVIGNENYVSNRLQNPIHDATAIAEVLKRMGFYVLLKENLSLNKFYLALDELKENIEVDNTILFFYFAGHGNTLNKSSSEEYLMMTDRDKKVLISIYKLYDFLNSVKAKHNIVVIDACRDYQENYLPIESHKNRSYISRKRGDKEFKNFRGNFRATFVKGEETSLPELIIHDDDSIGLFPQSTIISYATMHNQIAKDWSIYDKNHSPYTRALIKYLDDEEIPIEEVFRRVRIELIEETNRQQINLEENSLEKNVWLVPKKVENSLFSPI